MHYASLTPNEFANLHAELRDPDQIVLPSGGAVFHIGRHPEYERVVTIHDGDRIGMLASRLADTSVPLGQISEAKKEGAAWASLVALGGLLA